MKNQFQYASYHDMGNRLGRERLESTCELVVFSAANIPELLNKMQNVLDSDEINHETGLKWISYQSQNDFYESHCVDQYRATVVAYGVLELKRQLTQLMKMIKEHPHDSFSHEAAGLYYGFDSPKDKLAFIFPGHGSQYVGMGGQLREIYPKTQEIWNELGGFSFSGKTLEERVFPPMPQNKEEASHQAKKMSHIDWSMPSVNLVSESIRVLFDAMCLKPDAVAAHSAGDAASYCAAGVISKEQMIRFAGFRGVAAGSCPMSSKGRILMVFSEPETIRTLLGENRIKQVWIANYNSPTLTVLSGRRDNLQLAKKALAKKSIRSKLIPINAAPHCPLSLRAINQFTQYIAKEPFNKATCDIYSYLFGDKLNNDSDLYQKVIAVSCLKPVRFVDQINKMYADGIRTFVEVGPSDGNTIFIKRILADKPHHAICTNKQKGDDNYHFLSAVAELIKLGRIQDTRVLWEGYKTPTKPEMPTEANNVQRLPDMTAAIISREMDRLKSLDLQLSRINRAVNE